MMQRVECRVCKAHRDLVLSQKCLVCGAESCTPVHARPSDRTIAVDRVIRAAEQVDIVLWDFHSIQEFHRAAVELRDACKVLTDWSMT